VFIGIGRTLGNPLLKNPASDAMPELRIEEFLALAGRRQKSGDPDDPTG
jgi:hypothetical protein